MKCDMSKASLGIAKISIPSFFIVVVFHFKVELLNSIFLGLDLAWMIMITYVFVNFKACLINI
jgi:hypothetical protein